MLFFIIPGMCTRIFYSLLLPTYFTLLVIHFLCVQITFLVTHFNDTRIANLDIRDALLQSISVLMQYKEHVVAFESNAAATSIMPATLLSSFDNRFWIPVTNILLRLCKGTGFGCSKSSTHGESCSLVFQVIAEIPSIIVMFTYTIHGYQYLFILHMACQKLLRKKCVEDEKLFSSFLNRLFNTLNWTITEWSVSMRDIREQSGQHQVPSQLLSLHCIGMIFLHALLFCQYSLRKRKLKYVLLLLLLSMNYHR